MPIAAYHWVDPTKDAEQQVADSLKIIRDSGLPVLAIFPDFEQYWSKWDEWYAAIKGTLSWNLVSRFSGDKLSVHAKKVFEEFEKSEWRVFGYTRASFVREYAPQAADWISSYRWWLAHYLDYGNQTLTWDELKSRILPTVNFAPALPPGIKTEQVVGHQFTGDELSLPGLYGDAARTKYSAADVSLFDEQFLKEIDAMPDSKPLPEVQYEAVVTAYPTLNVRSGPSFTASKLYALKQGTAVHLSEITNGWAKIQSFSEEWCSEEYLKIITAVSGGQGDVEPVNENPVVLSSGIIYQRARRYNADCHILVMDLAGKRFHVTPYKGLRVVSQVGRELGALIVINGDGWGIGGRYPNSIAASDGNFYMRSQMDYRPWVNISRENKVTFDWRNPVNLYNAVSGDRYLIQYGKYNEAITNVTKAPRTAVGLSQQGKLILIVADGRTSQSAGLSFREVSNVLLEFGAVTAINLDGGGSSAMWIKDRIVNVPIDENVPGKERPVANHLCVFLD
jgi:hypothetical protein